MTDEPRNDTAIKGGPMAHRARATVDHETGHAVLHVPEMRRQAALLPTRTPVWRAELAAFRDPEWQAWTFALALLIPPRVVGTLTDTTPVALAGTFQVSHGLAVGFHKRFKGGRS